jgi:hypothetical protein
MKDKRKRDFRKQKAAKSKPRGALGVRIGYPAGETGGYQRIRQVKPSDMYGYING